MAFLNFLGSFCTALNFPTKPGLILYIFISCWTLNENLFAVILGGIYNLLDQILATAGSTLIPSKAFVVGIFGTLLVINSA